LTLTADRRQRQILEFIEQRGWLSVAEISNEFGVSSVTARHDLFVLADSGSIQRVRGGARYVQTERGEAGFERRCRQRTNEKRLIATAAVRLLGDAQIVALDASTTCYHLALELHPTSDLFVVTNGLRTAEVLAERPGISVMMPGGSVRPGGPSMVGEIAEEQIRRSRVEIAFVGARGFSPEYGLMDMVPDEARLKRALVSVADRVVGLVDHTKWGRLALMPPVVLPDQLSAIVTDRRPTSAVMEELDRRGIEVVVAQDEAPTREGRRDPSRRTLLTDTPKKDPGTALVADDRFDNDPARAQSAS
jgi:DeoR/GlpR family transcriptional regulator of sugar metabolism